MASPCHSSYFYRGTFIHEAEIGEHANALEIHVRSHSAPAQRLDVNGSVGVEITTDQERENYTKKLAGKVDEFVRQHTESSMIYDMPEKFLSPREQEFDASPDPIGLPSYAQHDFVHAKDFTPSANSPKDCTARPPRLQGYSSNTGQYGWDARGKIRCDIECPQRPASGKCEFFSTGSLGGLSMFTRQVSEISTIAGCDDTNSSEHSEAADNVETVASDRDAALMTFSVHSPSSNGTDDVKTPKESPAHVKVKRSRPPKFIRERMKRKQRDEAISSLAPTALQGVSTSRAEARAEMHSPAMHIVENRLGRGHEGSPQVFYPPSIGGQHLPPPR